MPITKDSSRIQIAAAYIRVSTDDQVEYSPAAQLRELRDYAASHNMVIDDRYVYADEGISGRKAENRPRFMQMISDAKTKPRPFDVVLVHKFDRFARSREDSIVYKSVLKRCGVEVVSIKEPLAEGSYAGVMEAIYESFAEAYSLNLAQEVRKGMTEKALRGELQSTPPFGYIVENGVLVPEESTAPIVVEIFNRYLSGEGFFPIARWVNSLGIKTRRGGKFANRTVEYILKNPTYTGVLSWNPKRPSRPDRLEEETITAKGGHVPLVSEEIFNAVQKRIEESKATHRYHGRPCWEKKHWLSGIVRCSACNSTLIMSYGYFKCSNYARGQCLHSQHIRTDLLESAFISRLQYDFLSSSSLSVKLIKVNRQNDKATLLRNQLDKLNTKVSRLTEAYLAEALSLEDFKQAKTALTADIDSIKKELESIDSESQTVDHTALLRAQIEAVLKTLASSEATLEQKFESANSIIDHCVFDKRTLTLEITYRLSI